MNGKYYESEYEEAFCDLLREQGWIIEHGDDLHRKYTDALLEEDLMLFLRDQYSSTGLTDTDYANIVSRLRNISGATDYASHREAYKLYHDGLDISFSDHTKPSVHIDYIDYQKHDDRCKSHNIFRAVNQFEMHEGKENRRPDIMLFINGIPVGIIELKNPTDQNATIRDAHTQICLRYRRDIFSLLRYCAIACISDGSNSRLGSVFTPYEYFYAWKKIKNEDKPGKGVDQMKSLIAGALSPDRIVQILRDYIFIPDVDEKDPDEDETEIVCRYPQFFASEMLRDNILHHLRSNGGDGKGGTYFGATGCGKTYTMLFLAKQLAQRCRSQIQSPTILIIVDREDLESQAGKLFCKATWYMDDKSIKVFDSRQELGEELRTRESGGLYITTIQKFTKETGLLSNRSNIICFSDEAHRSQTGIGSQLKIKDKEEDSQKLGAFITYGFAQYLRDALPNATYVGFTGTPIDETVHVFGAVVDRYTMREAKEDDITVDISYVPRLARVFADSDKIKEIEKYYAQCAEDGANKADVEKSQRAMSKMNVILGDPQRLQRLAVDVVAHYESSCEENPAVVQKAMIVCSDRKIAYNLYNILKSLRPEWVEKKRALDETVLSEEDLQKLDPVQFLNIVATRDKNDPKEMYELLGDKEYRKNLAKIFKNDKSNFRIVIVVDMWITGFDAPCLTIMYNDKPLQKHTLIQTISRVNRKYPGKDRGILVDYLGIRGNMLAALKQYGGDSEDGKEDNIDEVKTVFANELRILQTSTSNFDFTPFFGEKALERLQCLQEAAEFIMSRPDCPVTNDKGNKRNVQFVTFFRGHVKRMKSAYNICMPAGVLSEEQTAWAQCFMGIQSFVNKITDTHYDVDSMNAHVEQMLKEALTCSGVEAIIDAHTEEEIFGDAMMTELNDVKLPNTKFQLLAKMLARAIREYSKTNQVKAQQFKELLDKTIEEYNNRDKQSFAPQSAKDVVNAVNAEVQKKIEELTQRLFDIFNDLKTDKEEFKKLGITFEEKAFYDILVDVRDKNGFEYPDDKCIALSKKIKTLVDGSSMYADWINNNNIRSALSSDLLDLLYNEGYPPEWSDTVFDKILLQVNNYKLNQ